MDRKMSVEHGARVMTDVGGPAVDVLQQAYVGFAMPRVAHVTPTAFTGTGLFAATAFSNWYKPDQRIRYSF